MRVAKGPARQILTAKQGVNKNIRGARSQKQKEDWQRLMQLFICRSWFSDRI